MKQRKRIREWMRVPGNYPTGPRNSITDVEGVTVGHCTLHDDASGIHTGVTVIQPHAGDVFAHALTGALDGGDFGDHGTPLMTGWASARTAVQRADGAGGCRSGAKQARIYKLTGYLRPK